MRTHRPERPRCGPEVASRLGELLIVTFFSPRGVQKFCENDLQVFGLFTGRLLGFAAPARRPSTEYAAQPHPPHLRGRPPLSRSEGRCRRRAVCIGSARVPVRGFAGYLRGRQTSPSQPDALGTDSNLLQVIPSSLETRFHGSRLHILLADFLIGGFLTKDDVGAPSLIPAITNSLGLWAGIFAPPPRAESQLIIFLTSTA